jgi:hypothetical protein
MATTCKLIAKNTLGSDAGSVTFSDIPGTYTDLLLVCSSRTDRASNVNDGINVQFNGNGSGYSTRALEGTGSGVQSRSFGSNMYLTQACTGASATASTFGNAEMYIPNYAGSTNKSASSSCVGETNATGAWMSVDASLWSNTAAITSIALTPITGPNFKSGSSFFLYGILKA